MTPETLKDLIRAHSTFDECSGESVTRQKAEVSNTQAPLDVVNAPSHYTYGGIETIDYMMAKASPEEFRGHLRLTAIKYLSRAGHKDDILQEYKKAAVYLNWLIKYIETGTIR